MALNLSSRSPIKLGIASIYTPVLKSLNLPCPEGQERGVAVAPDGTPSVGACYPKTTVSRTSLLSGLANFGVAAFSNFLAPGAGFLKLAGPGLVQELRPATMLSGPDPFAGLSLLPTTRRSPMAWADGDSGFFGSDVLGGLGQVLQGGLGQSLLNIGENLANTAINSAFSSTPSSFNLPATIPTQLAMMPAIARGGAMAGRALATRFPNLATAISGYLARGIPVTRGKLWSLLKRFGPDFLVTGGILTAAAVSELSIAGPGRRRMNPGNVKALRRAHRRMKSFHHVCRTNDMLLGGRRKGKRSTSYGGTSITQVK